jgi:5-oxoprolinase (ATP-hydrolysing) subunit A
MKTIDINCDMGEGIGNDELIMLFISSANIACGFHAGDGNTMKETVSLCIKHNVSIGAHPSFADRENFGRSELKLTPGEMYDLVVRQIKLLEEIVKAAGSELKHVKPHGALYNMAAKNSQLAAVISLAVKDVDPKLILFGLSGSQLIKQGKNIGLKTASEVFADRTYLDSGNLTPRHLPGALIEDADKSLAQVLQMVNEGTVTTLSGKKIPMVADTVCIHGDGVHAVAFAKAIFQSLKENNIEIKAIS